MELCRWRSSIKSGRGRQGGWVGVLPCRVPTLLPVFVWGTWLTQRAERLQRRAQRPAAKTQRLQINEHTDSGSFTQQKAMSIGLKNLPQAVKKTKKKNAFEESYNSPRACMWICKWKKILAFVGCIELVGVFTAECVCVWRCLDILRVTPHSNRFDVFERKINGVILKVIRKKTT